MGLHPCVRAGFAVDLTLVDEQVLTETQLDALAASRRDMAFADVASWRLKARGSSCPLAAGEHTLVVAHRLTTVKDADLIVVLEHGRVAEQGEHEALLRSNGVYARLARAAQPE